MENKQSFYKTFEEKLLKGAIDKIYNDYVGGNENGYLDTGKIYWDFDEKGLCDIITNEILKTKTILWLENGYGLEAKHIRFIGKTRVREIVEHRVAFRHNKEGWYWEGR